MVLSVAWVTIAALGISLSIFLILIAGPMREARYYGLAMTGSILLLIPMYPLWPIGLPIGIWSLTVLGQEDVKKAFRERIQDPYR